MPETSTQTSGRMAAIYARVSSERQREEGTVQSQLAGLHQLADERGLLVVEELVFLAFVAWGDPGAEPGCGRRRATPPGST